MVAADGQSFWNQGPDVIAMFQAAYGDGAEAAWDAEHNAEISRRQQTPPQPPPAPSGIMGVDIPAYTPARSNPVQVQPDGSVTALNTGMTAPPQPAQSAAAMSGGNAGLSAYERLLADNAATAAANQAAELAYRNATLQGQTEDRAFRQAQQAWANTFAEKKFAWEQEQAGRSAEQWQRQFGLNEAGLTGMYQGAPTLARQAQQFGQGVTEAGLTGMYQGNLTQQAKAQQDATMMQYLGLQANLTGPRNAFKYARLLNSTPGGMADIINAAAGRYGMASFSGPAAGATPERASVQGLLADVNNPAGAGPGTYGPLPLPNQINAANYSRMGPSQRDLLYGAYEEQGYDPRDVEAGLLASLPRYGGARTARVALR